MHALHCFASEYSGFIAPLCAVCNAVHSSVVLASQCCEQCSAQQCTAVCSGCTGVQGLYCAGVAVHPVQCKAVMGVAVQRWQCNVTVALQWSYCSVMQAWLPCSERCIALALGSAFLH